ncbi:3470_t:CDS:2 [Entrophospora sp. SA101]|nr:3470_t:CDS:2 [Entrophospora sp. SA101]
MSTKRRTTLTALQKKELCLLKQRDPNIPNVELAVNALYNEQKFSGLEVRYREL